VQQEVRQTLQTLQSHISILFEYNPQPFILVIYVNAKT